MQTHILSPRVAHCYIINEMDELICWFFFRAPTDGIQLCVCNQSTNLLYFSNHEFASSVLRLMFTQAVCNLVSCPDSQLAAVEAGAVPCLRQLAKLGVPEIEVSYPQYASTAAAMMQHHLL